MTEILLIEPYAASEAGHYLGGAVRLGRALESRGARVRALVPGGAPVPGDAFAEFKTAWPMMQRVSVGNSVARRVLTAAAWRRYVGAAEAAARAAAAETAPDLVVIPTALPVDLEFATRLARGGLPVLAIAHSPAFESRLARGARSAAIAAIAAGAPLRVGASNARLRSSLIAAGLPADGVVSVPDPVAFPDISTPHTRTARSRPVVVSAGDARTEKGIVGVLGQAAAISSHADLVVQTHPPHFGLSPDVADAIESARGLTDSGVSLIDRSLSDEDYVELLQGADAVIVGYDPVAYGGGRISRVLLEAWGLGVPVVVSDGWWASDMVDQYGGGSVFDYDDSTTLPKSLDVVLARHDELAREAVAAGASLRKSMGPEAAADQVLRLVAELAGGRRR